MKKFLLVLCAIMSFNILTAQKNVLLEEATGTWCQYCPSGIYYIDSLVTMYDNVIAVAIHTNDVMAVEDYFNAGNFTQAPEANIGRRYQNKSTDQWFNFVQQEMEVQPKSSVTVENQFNETTRVLTSTITITALQNIEGNYRIGAILTEDAVTGPAPQYNQANQYSNYYFPMGGFENLPNPVPANRMAFDHVARHLLGGYNGETGMPTTLAAGQTYTHTFNYVLPEEYNHEYVRVIGVLISPDGSIDNAGKSAYLNGEQNAAPKFTSTPVTESFAFVNYIYNIYVYDTDNKELGITVEEKPEWLTFEQYDNRSAAIYGTTETPGEYEVVIRLTDGNYEEFQTYTIVVEEALDSSWEVIGDRAFTAGTTYTFSTATYNDCVYMFGRELGFPAVYKYDPQIDQWQKLTMPADEMSYEGNMVIDNNGVIYITYAYMSNDFLQVKKYENGQWSDVGTFGKFGSVPKLAVNSENVLYISYIDFDNNNYYFVERFINGEWERVGTGHVTAGGGSWARITIDENDVPYVSWVDFYAGGLMYVSKLVGDLWVKVGGQAVSDEIAVYYYQDVAVDRDGNVYLAYCAHQTQYLTVFRYNGTEWELLGDNIADGPIKGLDVALDSQQNFYVSYADSNMESKISVMKYDGEEWDYVGQRAFSEAGSDSYQSLTMLYDSPCVVFTDLGFGYKTSAMYYKAAVMLYPPTNLTAEIVNEDDAVISWNAPQQGTPSSYKVYRNDVAVKTTSELTYTDEDLTSGTHRYTVTAVYAEGESSPIGPVTVEVTVSVNENNEVAFVVYPNPAENYVMIESIKEAEVRIYSINGQMVSEHTVSEGLNTIDISSLNAGMYFMNVNNTMVKIVKK
ncbi:MAG: Omp28-related outer membrane protein [Bacteroidales bacterium]|nr:Omp28-related outer membrane protein [Bacteroidales bacterium]